MSALVHCDGPGCETVRLADMGSIPRRSPWIRVKASTTEFPLDFCGRRCLGAWAAVEPESGPSLLDEIRRAPKRAGL